MVVCFTCIVKICLFLFIFTRHKISLLEQVLEKLDGLGVTLTIGHGTAPGWGVGQTGASLLSLQDPRVCPSFSDSTGVNWAW